MEGSANLEVLRKDSVTYVQTVHLAGRGGRSSDRWINVSHGDACSGVSIEATTNTANNGAAWAVDRTMTSVGSLGGR